MNKKEWKNERRKWRMINKSSFPDEKIKNKSDANMVREALFSMVWKNAPKWFWDTNPRCFYFVRKIKDKWDIKLNIKDAPNSYPHPTKNP